MSDTDAKGYILHQYETPEGMTKAAYLMTRLNKNMLSIIENLGKCSENISVKMCGNPESNKH